MSEEESNGQYEAEPVEALGGEQYKKPADRGDPYDITNKKGKDPWKPNIVMQIGSWCFWLFMLYLCTAGFIYGYLTQGEDGEESTSSLADTIFIPAEMLRNYSFTYQRISDWQISFFRPEPEEDENGMPPSSF